eukprot:14265.XXX_825187_822227_1 [CDS] Oithona nana genome sequencing.
MDNFVYSKRDLIVAGVGMGIIVTMLGLGFGLTKGTTTANAASINASPSSASEVQTPPMNAYEAAVQILQEFPVIDGHNDFPLAIRELYNNDVTKFDFNSHLSGLPEFQDYNMDHTDLARMRKGQMGGQFWSAYMGCSTQFKDATQLFMEQIDVIKRLVEKYPNDMAFVTTAAGIEEAFATKKIASMIGVESGHAISSSLGVLRSFYELGARYMTLTHSCNTPWADSSVAEDQDGEPPLNNGLSEFGQTVVKEMNRLGIMVDLSHVSANTMRDALQVSRAPVIFSHSSARSVNNVSRNVPDDVLQQVKINRGIVMVNFYDCFVIEDCNNFNANVQDVVKHINHIRKVVGVDHIGIGADFNGVSKTPMGLEDTSKYPNLFAALLEDREFFWSKEDLGKLASANLIRVFKEVELVRDALQQMEEPYADLIPIRDLERSSGSTKCMSKAGLERA